MDIQSLKEYIHENNKIEYILSSIGCHNIKYHEKKEYYSAAHKDGDNPMGVVIYDNKYLNYISYSRNVSFDDYKDIVNLVQDTKRIDFIAAIKWVHSILSLEFTPYKKFEEKEKVPDPLAIFKNIRKKNIVDVNEIHFVKEDIINDYVPIIHISWFREGIMPWTAKKFKLSYSYKYKRMIIPHYYWMDGSLLGFNKRTVVENYKELGIKKYYLTEGMNKSINLYGLYENYEGIQENGYVVVYEGEKSVLKRHSLDDHTGVALSGKVMSEEQRRILIGLNVDIVIALDNDVDINEIRHICEKFYRIRNVYYIYDDNNELGEKDSVADSSNKIYNKLFSKKTLYDEEEHKKYLKSLNKK